MGVKWREEKKRVEIFFNNKIPTRKKKSKKKKGKIGRCNNFILKII